ncbi:polysaccharide deacetylase family protein [Phaeobacter sp. NW0010-22]|uniref:polysaccharide deacetylase family protein n=1 Tax=Phaeobacter sp. NW0010-22 TaxID=3135907 RepID=UPI003109FA20
MNVDWAPLDQELAHWHSAGMVLPIWWRDDDAIEPTPELNRLSELSVALGLPVHIAVIPATATPELATYFATRPHLIPVVHGWAHQNHAPTDQKKAEVGAHRPAPAVLDEIKRGTTRMRELFGLALRPMFVPPWNRIAPEVRDGLPQLGFKILSTATPRKQENAAPGLEQVNTHLDPIHWRDTRSLVPATRLIEQTVQLLKDRREGRADASEPFGLLTHHLVHDEQIWTFTRDFVTRLMAGPIQVWIMPAAEDE